MDHSPNPAFDVETFLDLWDLRSEFSVDLELPTINCEYPMYEEGGYHPVHLGDFYDNGRYRIVHKINYGNTSTIWLAHDSSCCSWVALRILQSDESTEVEENVVRSHDILALHGEDESCFITYTRYFHIDGPNGRHMCLVLPFCGPSLGSLSNYVSSRMTPRFARALAYQATEIVRDLHSHGICHDNVRPENFLVRIRNLDHLDDQGIYRLFGQPQIDLLKTTTGGIPGPKAPRYVVSPLDFMSSGEDILLNKISIIGFDDAFHIWPPSTIRPQPEFLAPEFLAPEVAIGKKASMASDVWALGFTILSIRSGNSPFNPSRVDCPSSVVTECLKYFGELPPSWEEPLYDEQGEPTQGKERGRPRETSDEVRSLKRWIRDIWDEPTQENENISPPAVPWTVEPEHRSRPTGYDWPTDDITSIINYDRLNGSVDKSKRPYPQHYANRVWKPSAFKIDGRYLPEVGEGGYPGVEDNLASLPRISVYEVSLLDDLLARIFVYEGRARARDILGHPWFRMVEGMM
ncbi:hypothetical protein ACHAPU_007839 [Fusarium lateritium]